MKTQLLIIGVLSSCVCSTIKSATIRVENYIKDDRVWAQLNDLRRDEALEENYLNRMKKKDHSGIFPHLIRIKPKKRNKKWEVTVLNSGTKPVKKITFFKIVDYQKEDIPWNELEDRLNSFIQQYGNMDITLTEDKALIHDGFNGKIHEYRRKKKESEVAVELPVFKIKEIVPVSPIEAGRSGVPIHYNGIDDIKIMPKK